MDVPKITDLPPKELEKELPDGTKKKIPNPAFAPAMQQLGEQMLTFLPDLQLRIDSATDAAEGLNVLYENMRKHRNYNFANEVSTKKKKKREQEKETGRNLTWKITNFPTLSTITVQTEDGVSSHWPHRTKQVWRISVRQRQGRHARTLEKAPRTLLREQGRHHR
jgi:hypothetical protein